MSHDIQSNYCCLNNVYVDIWNIAFIWHLVSTCFALNIMAQVRFFPYQPQNYTNFVNFIDTWVENGGVLLIGYEMYRMLASGIKFPKLKGRKGKMLLEDKRDLKKGNLLSFSFFFSFLLVYSFWYLHFLLSRWFWRILSNFSKRTSKGFSTQKEFVKLYKIIVAEKGVL